MFWDKVSGLYSLFEDIINGKVNRQLCKEVADYISSTDKVLECACGTGMITKAIASRCKSVIATDYSIGMLKQTARNCRKLSNVKVRKADITNIKCKSDSFDKVVAGNVIHLLDNPMDALKELERVCKPGGQIIIPTYVNKENTGKPNLFVTIMKVFGPVFKKHFTFESYRDFFEKAGYANVEYTLVTGRIPCAIAVITKK